MSDNKDKVFYQKGLFKSKRIEITDSGLIVKEKSIFNYYEYSLDFTDFTTKRIIKKDSNNGILFFVFMFSLATIVIFISALLDKDKGFGSTFFFLFFALAFLTIALLTKKKVIILPVYYGSNDLEISFRRSNERKARMFTDYLLMRIKNFLINKYSKIDKDLPKEGQLENLMQLRDRNLIDELEFDRLKCILLDKESDKSIGFN